MSICESIEETRDDLLDEIDDVFDDDYSDGREHQKFVNKIMGIMETFYNRVTDIIHMIFRTHRIDINRLSGSSNVKTTVEGCNAKDELSYFESYMNGMIEFIDSTMKNSSDMIIESELEKIADNDNQYVISCFTKKVNVTADEIIDQLADAIDTLESINKVKQTVRDMMTCLSEVGDGYKKRIKMIRTYVVSNIVYHLTYLRYIEYLCDNIPFIFKPAVKEQAMVIV